MNNSDMSAQALSGDTYSDFTLKGAGYNPECQGLTKREMFAMAAMHGLCSHSGDYHLPEHLAHDALMYADALLLALEETK